MATKTTKIIPPDIFIGGGGGPYGPIHDPYSPQIFPNPNTVPGTTSRKSDAELRNERIANAMIRVAEIDQTIESLNLLADFEEFDREGNDYFSEVPYGTAQSLTRIYKSQAENIFLLLGALHKEKQCILKSLEDLKPPGESTEK